MKVFVFYFVWVKIILHMKIVWWYFEIFEKETKCWRKLIRDTVDEHGQRLENSGLVDVWYICSIEKHIEKLSLADLRISFENLNNLLLVTELRKIASKTIRQSFFYYYYFFFKSQISQVYICWGRTLTPP